MSVRKIPRAKGHDNRFITVYRIEDCTVGLLRQGVAVLKHFCPETVLIFNGKNHSSPGTPICPVFGLVSRICPDFPISAAVCLHIGGQKLAQILSLYTKKLPQTPKLDLQRLTHVALEP